MTQIFVFMVGCLVAIHVGLGQLNVNEPRICQENPDIPQIYEYFEKYQSDDLGCVCKLTWDYDYPLVNTDEFVEFCKTWTMKNHLRSFLKVLVGTIIAVVNIFMSKAIKMISNRLKHVTKVKRDETTLYLIVAFEVFNSTILTLFFSLVGQDSQGLFNNSWYKTTSVIHLIIIISFGLSIL